MAKLLITIFIVCALFCTNSISHPLFGKIDPQCGVGGWLNNCASECDAVPTCAEPKPVSIEEDGMICANKCIKKCVCYHGFLMNDSGKCIRRRDCYAPKVE
ncbi:uncharacterized protein LOC126742947 [Anthonomus grandis grandis]|uniref:uncharacterized protein LOC126742947 n=1 Tax=Anthonomus grandis grandis TaxID=2921223 RepID=UPI002165EC7E|nr:uncharacterized protein LOC126742947 [Anthonomus grandis grandis]